MSHKVSLNVLSFIFFTPSYEEEGRKKDSTFCDSPLKLTTFFYATLPKDKEIMFYDRKQVELRIALGLGGGFLNIHSNFDC